MMIRVAFIPLELNFCFWTAVPTMLGISLQVPANVLQHLSAYKTGSSFQYYKFAARQNFQFIHAQAPEINTPSIFSSFILII